jgi:hypothetical protein
MLNGYFGMDTHGGKLAELIQYIENYSPILSKFWSKYSRFEHDSHKWKEILSNLTQNFPTFLF